MASFNPLASARDRALLLANTGEHPSWPLIAKALAHEGFGAVAIKQIGKDANAQREIAAGIHAVEQARLAELAAPAQTWRVEDPKTMVVLSKDACVPGSIAMNNSVRTLCCGFDELRTRAYEKADTGNFANWREVAAAIELENCLGAEKRLSADKLLTIMIDSRCWQAQNRP